VQWDVVALSVKPSLVYGEEDTILLSSLRQVSVSQIDLPTVNNESFQAGGRLAGEDRCLSACKATPIGELLVWDVIPIAFSV
jgi:hypothetical protein